MTEELISKFKRGECTGEENEMIFLYFKEHPDALQQYMSEKDWTNFSIEKNNTELSKTMYAEIEKRIDSPDKKRFSLIAITRAAAIIILMVTSSWFIWNFGFNQKEKSSPVVKNEIDISQDTIVENIKNFTVNIQLPDSSTVQLYPESKIRYLKKFVQQKRDIYLTGKAKFFVAKNKEKPFTVFAGSTATTALGTIFLVEQNMKTNNVNVHLYRGKVVIKKYSNGAVGNVLTYLNPGNDFSDVPKKEGSLKKVADKNLVAADAQIVHIEFDNLPLRNVFDSLKIKTGIKIKFNEKEISNISYTGAYDSHSQNIKEFLNTIGLLNGLSVDMKANNTYKVYLRQHP